MPEYRLFHFKNGRIVGVTVIVAEDDNSAEVQAAGKLTGRKGELWRGAKLLRTFNSDP